jgi:hypothetical protein
LADTVTHALRNTKAETLAAALPLANRYLLHQCCGYFKVHHLAWLADDLRIRDFLQATIVDSGHEEAGNERRMPSYERLRSESKRGADFAELLLLVDCQDVIGKQTLDERIKRAIGQFAALLIRERQQGLIGPDLLSHGQRLARTNRRRESWSSISEHLPSLSNLLLLLLRLE